MQLDYFYGNEAEQFTFYRIPKILVTAPQFKKVSDSAKLLYGLMLDRMGVSIKNGWLDNENRAYIYFTTRDVMEQMCCGTEKATKIFAELDSEKGIGLIERKKQGQGKPAIIYLKKFITSDIAPSKRSDATDGFGEETIPKESMQKENQDFRKSKYRTFENRKSRVSESESTDFRETKCSNNKFNNTELNNINLSHQNDIRSDNTGSDGWTELYNQTQKRIKEQIDYNSLVLTNNKKQIDEIVNIMTEVMIVNTPYYQIEGKAVPSEQVRIHYSKITYEDIETLLIEFSQITYKIHKTKAYLITALYNLASTSGTALANRVAHDTYERFNE